jgi:hypothetical protein
MDGTEILAALEANKDRRVRYSHLRSPNLKALRIIFLDFDGVINSVRTYAAYGKYPLSNDNRKDGENYVLDNSVFDKVAIDLINQLCKSADAYIVLSTSWRDQFNFWNTIEMCKEIGLDVGRVIGRTDSGGDSRWRGLQIQRFLDRIQRGKDEVQHMIYDNLLCSDFLSDNPIVVESYVILDDLDNYYMILDEQKSFLIHVDNRNGLSIDNVYLAGELLTNEGDFRLNRLRLKDVHTGQLW